METERGNERKNFTDKGLKWCFLLYFIMDQIGPKLDQKGLRIVFCTENTFFSDILFAEHTLSEEIVLDEVSLGARPTTNFALLLSNTDRPEAPRFVGDARGVTDAVISCYRNGTAPLL